jgi:uncharacterized OsmC-like protein
MTETTNTLEKAQTIVNGVNVSQLTDTINAIEQDPTIARFQFRAHHEWLDGTHAVTRVKDFYGANKEDDSRTEPFELHHDEPPVILGNNLGVNPVEYAMSALAGCVTTVFVVNAAARGINLKSVRVELEGEIDLRGLLNLNKTVRPGYEQIRMKYFVESDAPREEIEELLQYAKGKSPVHDVITNPVPVKVELAE